jgi:cytochrome c peroxidase
MRIRSAMKVGREWQAEWPRLPAGLRPTAITLTADGRRAYVSDTFGDTVAVIDVPRAATAATIELGPRPDLSLAEQGELLFYDARLSLDQWYSCHSCHTDGHTNGLLVDNLGDGSFGAPKRVLSLLGGGETGPWAWNGSAADLESQVRNSVHSTMQGRELRPDQIEALTTFLRSLPPPPVRPPENPEAATSGQAVFARLRCADCHVPPTYTLPANADPAAVDVGLQDDLGQSRFNPPSLRGVVHGTGYFHDNRAASLEQVFMRFQHQIPGDLPAEELNDLLAFLRTL